MLPKNLVCSGLLLLGSVFSLGSALQAGQVADAIDRMSPDAFRRCGLEKLSPAEIAELKAQLDASLSTVAPVAADLPRGEAAFGREEAVKEAAQAKQEIPESINSRIAGTFQGWSGATVFRLENGQVWRQVGGGSVFAQMESPGVTIERGALGAFFLRVEGLNSRVKVRRVR
jgi:hypothetical protein